LSQPIKIGETEFSSKKSTLEYYKDILNSYDFGASLSDEHYNDLIDLLNYNSDDYDENVEQLNEITSVCEEEDDSSINIVDIRIAKFQFNTKCFEVVYSNGDTWIISYRLFISNINTSPRSYFNRVCRYTIQPDLIKVKQAYFSKFAKESKAPCQESKEFLYYEDLVVDHRQPNTLSVIIDRFIEAFSIDVDQVEYKYTSGKVTLFEDEELANNFRQYHKEKALLRIVSKRLNLSRSGMARLKEMKNDIKIGQ